MEHFSLIEHDTEGLLEGREIKRPRLVAHPAVPASRKYGSMPEVGSLLTQEKLSGFFDLQLSREPRQLTEHLLFLGEIKRITDFEARSPGRMIENGQESDAMGGTTPPLCISLPKGWSLSPGARIPGFATSSNMQERYAAINVWFISSAAFTC